MVDVVRPKNSCCFPTVMVTGACGLIGTRVVDHLLKTKHDVIRVDKALGDDLTDEYAVRSIMQKHHADHLINLFAFNDHVAPGEKRGTLFDLPLASFDDCMRVNLTALFSVCREYARSILEGEWVGASSGNIINFGASTGMVSARPDMYGGAHKHVGYSVSKAGVIHLTRVLAAHLAPDITVNCISPGGIGADQPDEFKKLYASHTPMARMGRTTDILPAIDMLLKSHYMTGANIVIDGGWTII